MGGRKSIGLRVWGLNSLKGGYIGSIIGATKGDTRSLGCSPHEPVNARGYRGTFGSFSMS